MLTFKTIKLSNHVSPFTKDFRVGPMGFTQFLEEALRGCITSDFLWSNKIKEFCMIFIKENNNKEKND